jgi:hypothetical protein
VSSVNGDTTLFFFRSVVDRREVSFFRKTSRSQNCSDGSSQSGLSVVNVTNSSNIHVGFGTIKILFSHGRLFLLLFYLDKLKNTLVVVERPEIPDFTLNREGATRYR